MDKKLSTFSSGFTLIEVLIAIVIFSVGLLALAKLQIYSLRLTHDSLLRSTANLLAADMADRIRANPVAANLGRTGPYNNPTGLAVGNPNCLGKGGDGAANNSSCTTTQMAQHDFYEWNATLAGAPATSWYPKVSAELPNGAGIVCIDSTPKDGTPTNPACDNIAPPSGKTVYSIKVWWTERVDQQNPGTLQQYVLELSL